jgi:hypothetical protein
LPRPDQSRQSIELLDRRPDIALARDANLSRFADYFGFRYDLLTGDDRYTIEHAGDGFCGRVEAIRITENGRFGNIFYQILHAIMLGRQLGCHTILVFPFAGCPKASEIQVEELRVVFRPDCCHIEPRSPTLVGHFFHSFPFESALRAVSAAFVWETVQRYMKPLFVEACAIAGSVGSRTLVMSFRSGDIFRGETASPWYVQPPASYYMQALQFARTELGVIDVRLVFEDRGNPTIAVVESNLHAQGVPFAIQSGSFFEDFACLVGATHLVAPYSTFGEVAAILSDRIETYFGFRNLESHQHIHRRPEPLLLGVLQTKGIRAVLIDDVAGGYIAPRSWNRSGAQLRLMCDYPMKNLRITEGRDVELLETAEVTTGLRDQMIESQHEAARGRHRLIASRQETDAIRDRLLWAEGELDRIGAILREFQREARQVQERMERSVSWRITAPLRWAGSVFRRMRGHPKEQD